MFVLIVLEEVVLFDSDSVTIGELHDSDKRSVCSRISSMGPSYHISPWPSRSARTLLACAQLVSPSCCTKQGHRDGNFGIRSKLFNLRYLLLGILGMSEGEAVTSVLRFHGHSRPAAQKLY